MLAHAFAPYDTTIAAVLHAAGVTNGLDSDDGSHDGSHLIRVWNLVREIAADEPGVDLEMLAVATLLHDCVPVEKTDPRRAQASRLSAQKACGILRTIGWQTERVAATAHVIEAHSFSAGIAPETPEANILRDADRLDAIGAIGIARTFYVAGRVGSRLYDPADPFATQRSLDDRRFALDHFETKLLHLADGLTTRAAQRIGERRVTTMRAFLDVLREEISPSR
ncbi:HD domain-containing protein [Pandoraea pulmonicola]|uniref:Hydrolase n=1 Tax=Pandoraea pulmonicola TaxID=93221 RepID=A0AAJ4ZBV0_PANPU|nr:HD domain-containing protein [Pandoraea pulmonicola]AJC20940.1 phosphohydrolase [Pandoraea pulmonicola]SUA90465.1 putative hydrolase [Pandoraea pulmonicola]